MHRMSLSPDRCKTEDGLISAIELNKSGLPSIIKPVVRPFPKHTCTCKKMTGA